MLNLVHADGRKYSLDRDVLSVFPHVTAAAAHNELAEPRWDDTLRAYLADAGLTAADLVPTGSALAKAVAYGAQINYDGADSLGAVLDRSGFQACKPSAACAAFYTVGRQAAAAHHHYARHAFRRRETAQGFDDAAEAAARAAWALARNRPREARDPKTPGPGERPAASGGKYAASRDVVYLFLDVTTETAVSLAAGWPGRDVAGWAGRAGVPDTALAAAVRGLAGLAEAATKEAGHDPEHAWAAAGLDAAPPPVRFAVFATLGFEMLRAYHEHAAAVTAAAGGETST